MQGKRLPYGINPDNLPIVSSIATTSTSTPPFSITKLPPSSQEELVLLRFLMRKEIADLKAGHSEPQRLRIFHGGNRGRGGCGRCDHRGGAAGMGPSLPPQNSGSPCVSCSTPGCHPGICHEMHPALAAYLESQSPLQDQAAHSQVQQGPITASPLPCLC